MKNIIRFSVLTIELICWSLSHGQIPGNLRETDESIFTLGCNMEYLYSYTNYLSVGPSINHSTKHAFCSSAIPIKNVCFSFISIASQYEHSAFKSNIYAEGIKSSCIIGYFNEDIYGFGLGLSHRYSKSYLLYRPEVSINFFAFAQLHIGINIVNRADDKLKIPVVDAGLRLWLNGSLLLPFSIL